ncbi:retrovirus-related pol polyprotein from transposon TNT 1-94 [Tanacetum coccineum]
MSSNFDDIQAAGSDTRPPMLDRTDYDSWDTLGTTPEGGVLLGPERPRTYDDLNDNDKKRFDVDVRATNIMLPGEKINEYYVRFHKLVNDMRNIIMTMPTIQLNSKFMNNMSPEWDRVNLPQTNNQLRTSSNTHNQATVQDGRIVVQNVQGRQNQNQRNFARGAGATGNRGAQNIAGNANAGQGKPIKCYNCNGLGHIVQNCTQPKRSHNSDIFKDKMLLMQAQENGAVLDEEELLFLADECDAFDSDVDDEPTAQTIFMANLSLTGPANLQAGPSNASILSESMISKNAIDPSE